MLCFLKLLFGLFRRFVRSRRDLLIENLALRQQLAVYKRRKARPKLDRLDRLFWIATRRLWAGWKNSLIIVSPETVVGWHRAGFRIYWKWLSRHSRAHGSNGVNKEVRRLVSRMVAENPSWGAPRIHGELLKLGFDLSERTVSRWVKRAPRQPNHTERWKTFLSNHREAIAAMDFFTVPTITFRVLCCFFVIGHDRRRILHFGVTKHPTSFWVTQQLREALPYQLAQRYLIFDGDAKFGEEVIAAVAEIGVTPALTSFRSPGRME